LWRWIDAHGQDFGIGRPYLEKDPPHVAPINGKEYADHRGVNAKRVGRRLSFVGTPLQSNCYNQSVASLATQYGEIIGAAAALGFPSLSSLQGAIKLYCNS
jgi:hypothetical protein